MKRSTRISGLQPGRGPSIVTAVGMVVLAGLVGAEAGWTHPGRTDAYGATLGVAAPQLRPGTVSQPVENSTSGDDL